MGGGLGVGHKEFHKPPRDGVGRGLMLYPNGVGLGLGNGLSGEGREMRANVEDVGPSAMMLSCRSSL